MKCDDCSLIPSRGKGQDFTHRCNGRVPGTTAEVRVSSLRRKVHVWP